MRSQSIRKSNPALIPAAFEMLELGSVSRSGTIPELAGRFSGIVQAVEFVNAEASCGVVSTGKGRQGMSEAMSVAPHFLLTVILPLPDAQPDLVRRYSTDPTSVYSKPPAGP